MCIRDSRKGAWYSTRDVYGYVSSAILFLLTNIVLVSYIVHSLFVIAQVYSMFYLPDVCVLVCPSL